MDFRSQISDRLALDPNLSYGGATRVSEVSLPITFSASAGTVITSQTIPGGLLGANGYIELYAHGAWADAANRSVTLSASATSAVISSVSSQNLTAGVSWTLEFRAIFQNNGSETSNSIFLFACAGRSNNAPEGPYQTIAGPNAVDTTQDWTFSIQLTPSTTVSTAALYALRITSYYIP